MNYLRHPYPKDLDDSLKRAKLAAKQIKKFVASAPTLNELYEKGKNGGNKKVGGFFDLIGHKPTIRHNTKRKKNEIKGLYFFAELKQGKINPMYVGISRTICRRIYHHGFGYDDNQSSLAYIIASHKKGKAKNRKSLKHMQLGKDIVKNFRVVVYPLNDDYEMYFFEVVIAGILKTKYNKFKTH